MNAQSNSLGPGQRKGWIRLGLAMSALWVSGIFGYASYQYFRWEHTCSVPGPEYFNSNDRMAYFMETFDRCSQKDLFVDWLVTETFDREALDERASLAFLRKPIPQTLLDRLGRGSTYEKHFRIENLLLMALIPIISAWFLGYVLIRIYRWVRDGFTQP